MGAGGLSALAQIIMAAMISPRERGRYTGYLGAAFAVATVGGPLLGGVITDTSWLGWRWCFYVGVPFAVARADRAAEDAAPAGASSREGQGRLGSARFFITAAVSPAARLGHLRRRQVRLDVRGRPRAMVGGGDRADAALPSLVESPRQRADHPAAPVPEPHRSPWPSLGLAVRRHRDVRGHAVFFSQYFQLARGKSPTDVRLS